MRGLLLLGLTALLLGTTTACGDRPATASVATGERVEIYIAVLRRYLTTPGENSFGGGFGNVYVLSHTDPAARDAGASSGPGTPIPTSEQTHIVEALADLGNVRFVDDPDDAIVVIEGCAQVPDGILMTLGDVESGGDRVEVAVNGFVACLGATWLTYVVRRDSGGWRVTGTTGGIAVA